MLCSLGSPAPHHLPNFLRVAILRAPTPRCCRRGGRHAENIVVIVSVGHFLMKEGQAWVVDKVVPINSQPRSRPSHPPLPPLACPCSPLGPIGPRRAAPPGLADDSQIALCSRSHHHNVVIAISIHPVRATIATEYATQALSHLRHLALDPHVARSAAHPAIDKTSERLFLH